MFAIILALLVIVAGFVITKVVNIHRVEDDLSKISFPSFVGILLAIVILVASCIQVIPNSAG